MAIETADEAVQSLNSAGDLISWQREPEATPLLDAIEQSGLLPSDQQPRLLWLQGEAAYQAGSYDAAHQYYTQAASAGDSTIAQQANARLAEFGRMDSAIDTAGTGIDDFAELEQVTAAAEEALARQDLDGALSLFRQAYEFPNAGNSMDRMARVALGLGRTLFQQQQYDQAREYLVYVGQLPGAGDYATQATAELAELDQYQRVAESAGDGVQAAEIRDAFEAANGAYDRGDYAGAASLYESVHSSPVADGSMRAVAAYNAGSAHRRLGSFDTSLHWFETSLGLGYGAAQSQIDRLRAGDNAMEDIGADLVRDI